MKKLILLGSLSLLAPASVFAGTCAAPTPLNSGSDVTGTTCGGVVGINMGGTVYPHPSVVYSVTINHGGPDGSPLGNIALGGTNIEAVLTASCTDAPIALAAAGAIEMPVEPLPDGDYLLVVSTDPSIPVQPAPGVCGDYSVTAGTLPVTLQDFSVE